MNTGGYPTGTENDKKAPYNRVKPPNIDVDIFISETLSKNGISCITDDYEEGEHGVNWDTDFDEYGNSISVPHEYQEPNDFSCTDWQRVASRNKVRTPVEIMAEFDRFMHEMYGYGNIDSEYLEYWSEQCRGWIVDDCVIDRDDL